MKISDLVGQPRTIVVYGGRFQPFHKGHYAVYNHLVEKFGKNNVFIASSDNQDTDENPFSFNEKKKIATTMFNIPSNKFIYTKIPYDPQEILSKFDFKKDHLILAVSEKDSNRLVNGKYFIPLTDNNLKPFEEQGYVYITPMFGDGISASFIRAFFDDTREKRKKQQFIKDMYGKFDPRIFDLINDRLS